MPKTRGKQGTCAITLCAMELATTLLLVALTAGVALAAHLSFWGRRLAVRRSFDAKLTAVADDGWKLEVRHWLPRGEASLGPVVLSHGFMNNADAMTLPGPNDLAVRFRDAGFEVFAVSLRGATGSAALPRGGRFAAVDFDAHVLRDAPAVLRLVEAVSGPKKVLWVGHSMGGLIGLALAQGPDAGRLAGVAALGSPTHWAAVGGLLRFLAWVGRPLAAMGRLPVRLPAQLVGPWAGRGPFPTPDLPFIRGRNTEPSLLQTTAWHALDDAPAGTLRQMADNLLADVWRLRDGTDLRAGLARIQLPVFLAGADSDQLAPLAGIVATHGALGTPDRQLLKLGTAHGSKAEYGHGDLLVGRNAPEELFAPLIAWAKRVASGGAPSVRQEAP